MTSKNLLLIIAIGLIILGLFKPNIESLIINPKPDTPNVVVIDAPVSESLRSKCETVINILKKNNDRATDGKRLSGLYKDIATLIELDGENEVIKSTEEIRQANSLAGSMLKLDIKGKYPELAAATKDVVVTAIGDDHVMLNKDLRSKAVEGFMALSWACQEGAK